jgi:UDPglucose 6-dehydrogenase
MNIEKVSLIGLGKLGLPLLVTFAKNNQKIIGIDIDVEKINLLKEKKIPFFEPNLIDYLNFGYDNIDLNTTFNNVINDTDVFIILVNTPSTDDGGFSNKYIFDAIDEICKKINETNKSDFLIILSSTVMPGTHIDIINKVESKTNKKFNDDFGFVYIPDLVALGTVIKDFENPDVVILGESGGKYGDIAQALYSKIIKNNAPFIRMSLIESEITKISLNAFITMKISFANFIGNVSEKFGCNPNNITKALGYDKRISPLYIKSGLPFGGTCFPRDTWAFIKMSENIGLDAVHIKATQKINEQQNQFLLEKLLIFKDKKIGILGLSFKPNTSVTTESSGNFLYEYLKNNNYKVYGCDELVTTDFNYSNISEFIDKCEVIVITHDNKKILSEVMDKLKTKIVINPWNIEI